MLEEHEHRLHVAGAALAIEPFVESPVFDAHREHLQHRVVLDHPGCSRRGADPALQGRVVVVVEPVEDLRREPSLEQRQRQVLGRGRREQLVDQALRQRLRRVDEDELRALLHHAVGDECGDTHREAVDICVADRGGALLAVDDPALASARPVSDSSTGTIRCPSSVHRVSPPTGSNRTRESNATTSAFGNTASAVEPDEIGQ